MQHLANIGEEEKAFELLTANGGLVIDDLRECNSSIGVLWKQLYLALHDETDVTIPERYQFNSFFE